MHPISRLFCVVFLLVFTSVLSGKHPQSVHLIETQATKKSHSVYYGSRWNYSEKVLPWCSQAKNLSIIAARKVATSSPDMTMVAILNQDNTLILTSPFNISGSKQTCLNWSLVKTLSQDKDLICYDLEVFKAQKQLNIVVDCFQKQIETNFLLHVQVSFDNKLKVLDSRQATTLSPNYYPRKSFDSNSKRYLRTYQDEGDQNVFFRFFASESRTQPKRWHIERYTLDSSNPTNTGITLDYRFDSNFSPMNDIVIADCYPFQNFWLIANQTGSLLTLAISKTTQTVLDIVSFKNLKFQTAAIRQEENGELSALVSYSGTTGYFKIDSKGKFKTQFYAENATSTVFANWVGSRAYLELIGSDGNCSLRVSELNSSQAVNSRIIQNVSCPAKSAKYISVPAASQQKERIIKIQDGGLALSKINFLEATTAPALSLFAITAGKSGSNEQSNTTLQSNSTSNSTGSKIVYGTNKTTNGSSKNNSTNKTSAGAFDDLGKKYKWWYVALIGTIILLLVGGGLVFRKYVRRKAYTPEYGAMSGEDALI